MPQGCLMGLWKKKLLARPESCRTKRADSCARRTPGQPKWSQSKAHQARKSINLENVEERRSANLMCHCPKVSIDSIPSLFGQRLTNLLRHFMRSQNKKEEAFKAKNPSLCQHHSLHHQPGKEGLKTIQVSHFAGDLNKDQILCYTLASNSWPISAQNYKRDLLRSISRKPRFRCRGVAALASFLLRREIGR